MAPPLKVAIFGATGGSGNTIINGLLESKHQFDITAFTRPQSLQKPRYKALKAQGVNVALYDIDGPEASLVTALCGFDVLVSALGVAALEQQIPLAAAAKKAGVKRFVPSDYATSAPSGVVDICDQKEDVINHIKTLGLGYTVINVGWWYEGFKLKVPSGRTDYAVFPLPTGVNSIPGDGTVPSAMTSYRDVGRLVARIIADPRTLNTRVFAYGVVMTPEQAFKAWESVCREVVQRNYVSREQLLAQISEAREVLRVDAANREAGFKLLVCQYLLSWGIRGDNTPEFARELGYLDGKEIYPDFEPETFESFVQEVLDGRVAELYTE